MRHRHLSLAAACTGLSLTVAGARAVAQDQPMPHEPLKVGDVVTIEIDAYTGDEGTTEPKTDANDGQNGDNPQFRRHNVARAHRGGGTVYWEAQSKQLEGEPDPAGEQWVDYTPQLEPGIYEVTAEFRGSHHRADYETLYKVHHADGVAEFAINQKDWKNKTFVNLGPYKMDRESFLRVEDPGDHSVTFGKAMFKYLGPVSTRFEPVDEPDIIGKGRFIPKHVQDPTDGKVITEPRPLQPGEVYRLETDGYTGDDFTTEPRTDANDGKDGDNPHFQRHNVAHAHRGGGVTYWMTHSPRMYDPAKDPDPAGEQWVDYKPPLQVLGPGRYEITTRMRAKETRAPYDAIYTIHHQGGETVLKINQQYGWEGGNLANLGTYDLGNDGWVRIEDKGNRSVTFGYMNFRKVPEGEAEANGGAPTQP